MTRHITKFMAVGEAKLVFNYHPAITGCWDYLQVKYTFPWYDFHFHGWDMGGDLDFVINHIYFSLWEF